MMRVSLAWGGWEELIAFISGKHQKRIAITRSALKVKHQRNALPSQFIQWTCTVACYKWQRRGSCTALWWILLLIAFESFVRHFWWNRGELRQQSSFPVVMSCTFGIFISSTTEWEKRNSNVCFRSMVLFQVEVLILKYSYFLFSFSGILHLNNFMSVIYQTCSCFFFFLLFFSR